MAAPNILAATSIIGKSKGFDLGTTTTTTLLTCASNKVYKIKSIIASNNDGSNNVDVTVNFNDGTRWTIASTVTVPAQSTLVILDQNSPIYLEEGFTIEGGASAANDCDLIIAYEILDDA
jgi:hypothetical protein